jgi:succinoglycan biosynthesis protein ExoM
MPEVPHISVCICTYQRSRYLAYLLERLAQEETGGQFTHSVLVVDNDRDRSAESLVKTFAKSSPVEVQYSVEPRQSIALARNMAVKNARGDFIVFIDDDEFPAEQWLKKLFTECVERGVDGVLGPVKPYYEIDPPSWVVTAGFYDRPTYPTGLIIDGKKGRTGNVLLRKAIFAGEPDPFRPEFRTGEDQDFFQRMISKGHVFTWCNEALAYEWVPPIRWNRTFLLKRALLRGTASTLQPNQKVKGVVKSVIAIPAYLFILPFAFLINHGRFMRYLVSLFDHLGKLLSLLGINTIQDQYVTQSQ